MESTFLLIDDDDTFRKRLARALTERNFNVFHTGSPIEGIQLAAEKNPSHIIIDLRMPQKNGLEVLSEIRKINREALVLILTGYGSIATAIDAVREGATDYLTKPVDLERILTAFTRNKGSAPRKISIPSLDRVEWEHMERVLNECDGNVTRAAKLLGMHRRSLQRKLKNPPPSDSH